jgi:imidazolonepropionase-like amidohydrolase
MSSTTDPPASIAIRAGKLFTACDQSLINDAVVIVRASRIEAVGSASSVSISPDHTLIDLRPCTLLPGLIDAHVHLMGQNPAHNHPGPIEYRAIRSTAQIEALLNAGFTTVRDMGSQTSVALKRAIDDGEIPGSRMVAAGYAIARTGGPWFGMEPSWRWVRPADGVDACRKAVHQSIREGSSVIKIGTSTGHGDSAWGEIPTYSVAEVEAIVHEAHAWGLRVAAHAMGTPGVRTAVLGGVDTVEHAYNIDDETLGLIVERGTFIVPTLRGRAFQTGSDERATYASQIRSLRRAYEAGARLALGTDTTGSLEMPHGHENAVEFSLMADTMDPADALLAGTRVAAEALGLELEVGTIEPGKMADMVAVRDDPINNIDSLQHVEFVMQNGRIISRP